LRWALDLVSWTLNWLLLLELSLTLLLLRAFNRELQAPTAVTLSKRDYTVVFWPDSRAIPLPHQVSARTSTAGRSIWWSHLWTPWQMSATPGSSGVELGTPVMLSTLSYQELPPKQNGSGKKP